ncbi:MAG: AI-2E family transporter [Clostridiaceae bacterium]|nr:AI-2E family transporter [Clostridiaceae bacterium]
MRFDRNIRKKDIIFLALTIVATFILIDNYQTVFKVVEQLLSILAPFFYAIIFAYILNPIMCLVERKFKVKRGVAITISYILVVGIFALVVVYVLPSVVDSITTMIDEVPNYVKTAQGWMNDAIKNEDVKNLLDSTGVLKNLDDLTTKAGPVVINILKDSASSIYSFTTGMVKIVFGFLVSIYVLIDKEKLLKDSKTLVYMVLKKKKSDRLFKWLNTLNKMVGVYVGTKALDSLIIGVIALIGLILLNAPYAILLAIIVGFTNMIPYFGPLIGELVGAIVGVFVSVSMAIKIFIFLLLLQQFDAWYLDPKLIGNKVGVRPFFIILAVMIGGGFFGALGMILAAPVMATINVAFENRVLFLKEKNKELMTKIEE